MNKPLIPSHVAWPAFIILLFAGAIFGTFFMMWLAQRDGGPQVIEDYYSKAVDWDKTMADRAAGDALRWQVNVSIRPPEPGQDRPTLTLACSDSTGAPVRGLAGTVRLLRPQFAEALFETALAEDPETPGTYRQLVPINRPGLWDIQLEASRDDARFLKTIRTEVR